MANPATRSNLKEYALRALGKPVIEINADDAVGADQLASNAVVNASVSSSAAIAFSKMENLTASRVLVSDGSGDVSASSVTSTSLGFVDATSSIQTQLDTKASVGFAIAQAVALG